MATSIFFNGRVISVPGSYSEVNAAGLEQVGLGASGIVAALGTAEGGIPVASLSNTEDFIRLTKPEQSGQTFRSGNLREVTDMLFAPSSDDGITAGAQEVVCMKINPATQSAATLSNSLGDSLVLTSADYGEFTNQINVDIQDGTTQGKLLTITFEDTTETVDDLGGDSVFRLKYVAPTYGWKAMTGQVISGGHIVASGTRAETGAYDTDITLQLSSNTALEVLSDNAGDTTQTVTIIGLDDSSNPVKETLALNGTSVVSGTQTFSKVALAYLSATVAGSITLRIISGGATVLTLTAGAPKKGGFDADAFYMNGQLTLVGSAASTDFAIVEGYSLTGAYAIEKVALSGTTPVTTTGSYSLITSLGLGLIAVTVTTSGEAARAVATTQNTIQKAADYYNNKQVTISAVDYGFVFSIDTGVTTLALTNLDVLNAAVSILSPADPEFYADLYAMISWINANSQYVTAAAATGAKGVPDNTTVPVFLTGGGEGTASFTDWQNALNWLKRIRVNSVVALTGDPAVHAAVKAHCEYMGGIGRSERDAFLGALNTALDGLPTKTELKAQAVDLNTRHVRLCGQSIDRFNTSGERTTFDPYFTAAVAAGMQAGSTVGTSLTYKFANVLSFDQSSTWNPTDDAEEMIQAGILFLDNVDGVGRRWARNITTHLSSNNIAYIEGSVNEAVNFAAFNFRTNMEISVGEPGFLGTVNAAKGVAITTLGLLVDAGTLVTYRSLTLDLTVDILSVACEIAPVIPINFVKNTLNLVTVQQSAA